MSLLLDSFWRAVAYCLHPRVIALSFLPLVLILVLSWGLAYFYWDWAVDTTRAMLESSAVIDALLGWLKAMGASGLQAVLPPLLVTIAVTPLIVIVSLLLVALLMAPALVALVAQRRFAALERKQGASWLVSLLWSLGSVAMALLALVISVPLWLVPPLILVLPPLIWGWLTYRVMAFDAMAQHASSAERRELFRRHRAWLLGMGVLTGYIGAAPSLFWASGAMLTTAFVVLVPLAIWIYTLVFAFSALWFAHYCLAALEKLRAEPPPLAIVPAESVDASEPRSLPVP